MITFRKRGWCSVAGIALASLVGCSRVSEREPLDGRPTALADGMTPAARTSSAAEQLARARCEREQACGNVGANKTYASTADCLTRIRDDWREDLNARECPGGINQHELDECMQQVRGEACSNPFDALARITACTSGQICIEHS